MGLRDKLRKSDGSPERHDEARMEKSGGASNIIGHNGYAPEFTFVRSDTASMEVIHPGEGGSSHHHHNPAPAPHDDATAGGAHLSPSKEPSGLRRSLSIFHSNRSRSTSVSSAASHHSTASGSGSRRRRLSERLHLRHHQPESSDSVPVDLPAIVVGAADEAQWEQRATLLASQNEIARSAPGSPGLNDSMASLSIASAVPEHSNSPGAAAVPAGGRSRSRSHSSGGKTPPPKAVSSVKIDADIQEAIRLHEEGDLRRSTAIFGRLADTQGANNPLSQVLFGLALRHGWGCTPDTERAVTYLSAAASNAAAVEEMALEAGMKKGGAAKGELILAIFELANCFRHGWGIPKDPVAAKQYYETAANLGDTDAMNEAGWCYLEGFGCKKDKFASARYYRLAEKAGNKTLGNSWIWKEKYDPDEDGTAKKKKK
ncbi:hypothetical protein LMH87_005102 [Akanthomyces muscarius]|uniref:Tetratricopeptide-like helical n=1 Tax=Akanthomyces muscarius TaxID=2231603 RepID=A0A9W8QK16_AKAMU|nr:hypothetical protein LMH87_005102 [Akanthomyces muscarius]KAJ4163368.1 hypothetical protein LMH87_005102 [Akanthomyces muscarius]